MKGRPSYRPRLFQSHESRYHDLVLLKDPASATARLKTTAVICCYTLDRLDDIHAAIRSALDQTRKPDELLIAVDHNQDLLSRLQQDLGSSVSFVLNDGLQGLSETRNIATRAAIGDIVAFLDDDAVAEPDWLEKLVAPFSDARVAGVGGAAVPLWQNGHGPTWLPEELYWIVGCSYKGMPVQDGRIRNPLGCSMAFRKDALGRAGMFEVYIGGIGQRLKGGEEAELCLRMANRIPECLVLYEPASIIHHKVPAARTTLKWAITKSYQEGVCKAKVDKFGQTQSREPLSTESSYLRHLLFQAVPGRLLHCYSLLSLLQAGAILLSVASAALGYLREKSARVPRDREAYA